MPRDGWTPLPGHRDQRTAIAVGDHVTEEFMAKRCEVCNKGPVVGRTVSHAHNVGPRRFEPNLQTVKALVNGAAKRMRVCTRCLRSGKITKAA